MVNPHKGMTLHTSTANIPEVTQFMGSILVPHFYATLHQQCFISLTKNFQHFFPLNFELSKNIWDKVQRSVGKN
jgi:energy-coupling factor transporter transmembrane protein EcfT